MGGLLFRWCCYGTPTLSLFNFSGTHKNHSQNTIYPHDLALDDKIVRFWYSFCEIYSPNYSFTDNFTVGTPSNTVV